VPFYGWHIVWAGTLCIFACLGLGRFALGMLLPSMGQGLGLTYTQMGWISTANFAGYLVAVLFCGPLCKRFGHRLVIALSLSAIGVTMLLIGRVAHSPLAVMALYSVTGMGSGGANVSMMTLVSAWFDKERRGKATGWVVIGSGFAILLSGKLLPLINQSAAEGWRLSWQVLGLTVLGVGAICGVVLRTPPARPPQGDASLPVAEPGSWRALLHLGGIYFLFGFTYVIFVTFMVTALVQDQGFSETAAGSFWAWVGGLSLLSGPIFGSLSDRVGRRAALSLVFTLHAAAYLLAAVKLPAALWWLPVICFGVSAWSVPSIMAALVADQAGNRAAHVFGVVTFIFGWGQILGPVLAGWLAESSGDFRASFLLAASGAALALFLSLKLPNPPGMPAEARA